MRQEIAELDREIVERDQELERLKAQIDKCCTARSCSDR